MRYFCLLAAVLFPFISEAQISSAAANAVRYTAYPSSPAVKDPVFIFCNASGSVKGSLTAVSPGGTGPFNFTWYKWNNSSRSFSDLIRTETSVPASTVSGLDEGGYRVSIAGSGGYTISLTGWVFLDRPSTSAQLRHYTCDYVALSGRVAVDTFYYSDPGTGQRITLPNRIRFLWSSEPSSSIPYPDLDLNPQTFDPPLVNVTYMLQATDSFSCSNTSSFLYESIHVKADFTADPPNGEAPLDVTFTDKSVRAASYKWEFGDDSVSLLADPPLHTYYIPGEYQVKLTVESDLHCIDSMRFESIIVESSGLDIPNVFTPNDDGTNDRFMVDKSSLRYISVDIFSRSGIRVYSFYGEGPMLKEWDGWDGNVNNTSIKASPGVYFYIIRALGWDDVKYEGKNYRGFVYLYR